MWRITGRVENHQAIIHVGLQRFLPQPPAVQATYQPLQIPIAPYRALIDTGAQMTGISRRAIHDNGLTSSGRRLVATGDGTTPHRRYNFFLNLVCEAVDGVNLSSPTIYVFPAPEDAIDMENPIDFDVVIGMNILKKCDLHFDRRGTFSIEFYPEAFRS